MKCSVFIATSVDGFIARANGSIDWLQTAGQQGGDMGEQADMGFKDYFSSVDCIIMGRKCMDMIASMDLHDDSWPYGDKRIIVLSQTRTHPPENLKNKVEIYGGDIRDLMAQLSSEGYHHAYIDGGKVIQAFLNLGLIDEITLTRAPILLGEGKPLFGKTFKDIHLKHTQAKAFPNGFVQVSYTVSYA